MSTDPSVPVRKLILVPGLISLGVTLLRLIGELMGWSRALFNPDAGGGGAVIGIVWLIPVFGVLFALQLGRLELGPSGLGRAIGFPILGMALLVLGGLVSNRLSAWMSLQFASVVVASIVASFVCLKGWPALGRTLLAYALVARIPVALIMLVAIVGNWGTHYDVPPPDFPEMGAFAKWILIGLIPQLTIWVAFTMAVGGVFGAVAFGIFRKRLASVAD